MVDCGPLFEIFKEVGVAMQRKKNCRKEVENRCSIKVNVRTRRRNGGEFAARVRVRTGPGFYNDREDSTARTLI